MESSRKYPEFSACGLNCGLCPRYHTDGVSRCPGCGGEGFAQKRPPCGILSCNTRHGVEFCYLCEEFPCPRLHPDDPVDSFITHRHMRKDGELANAIGIEAYMAQQKEKLAILQKLLAGYNDGRKKSLYCLAVNLLELSDLRDVMEQLENEAALSGATRKEKAAFAAACLQAVADARGVVLKLRGKG